MSDNSNIFSILNNINLDKNAIGTLFEKIVIAKISEKKLFIQYDEEYVKKFVTKKMKKYFIKIKQKKKLKQELYLFKQNFI